MASQMKAWQWMVAVILSALGLGISMISFGVGYTYSRVEGDKLGQKVTTLEQDAKSDRKEMAKVLRNIDSRLSNIEGRLGAKKWVTKSE